MKKLILLFFTLPHWISAHAQMIPYKDIAVQIIESIAGNHYAPIAIDNNFSEKLFKNFINTLDSRRLYFTAEDYARLSNYMYSLDDELKSKPWKFLPEISILYKTRLQESEKICADLLNKTFKLNSTDTYEHPDTDTMLFFPASLLKKHWGKWLRYQVLHIMFGPHTAINDDSMKSDKELIALENEIKQKVLKLEQRYIKRITEHRSGYEEYYAFF